MSMTVAEVEAAMLALDRGEIAALVHRGIQVLDRGDSKASQAEVDEAWRDEVARRVDDIRTGRVEIMSIEGSFAQARAALNATES